MSFSTFSFVFIFLPVVLTGYYLIARRSFTAAKFWLLASSFVFYGWSFFNPEDLSTMNLPMGVLLVSLAANYILGEWQWHKPQNKWIFAAGILFNVILLGYFKYRNFFVENLNTLFAADLPLVQFILPLGISYFTFQQILYLHKIYSGSMKVRSSLLDYTLFIMFFPQLVLGPILVPDELIPQLNDPEKGKFEWKNFSTGIFVFILGLAKKILFADNFAPICESGFSTMNPDFGGALTGTLAYTFQLYFDFSGYCDMAVGIALMFNFILPVNFDSPYKSADIREFWQRWHITLGRFLSSMIYFPLGGSKCSTFRTLLNLLITFLVSGLWHGASWLFVLWGGLHGIAMVVHRIWSKTLKCRMPHIPGVIVTFLFVSLAWIPFRATSFEQAVNFFRALVPGSWAEATRLPGWIVWDDILLFLLSFAVIAFFPNASSYAKNFKPTIFNIILAVVLFTGSVIMFTRITPFVYVNF